jgi:signal transduction histidine kinase
MTVVREAYLKPALSIILTRLRADSFLAFALLAWLFVGFSHIFPLSEKLVTGFEVTYSEMFLLGLAAVFFARSANRATHRPARLFWLLAAASIGFWFIARATTLLTVEKSWWHPDLIVDSLYLGYYGCLIAAVELRLDTRRQPFWFLHRATATVTGLVLLLAIFAYFSLLPYLAKLAPFQSYFFLYAAVDAYLAGRMLLAAILTGNENWRLAYLLMAIMLTLIAVADILSWLYRANYISYDRNNSLNFVWYLWCPAAYVCGLVKFERDEQSPAPNGPLQIYPATNTLLVFGLALPVVHLAGYSFGLMNPDLQAIRTLFVTVWLVCVAVLLLSFHSMLRRKVAEVIRSRASATERAQQLESQLQRVVRMGTLSRLSAGLAHDLGNTVAALKMHAEVIAENNNTGDIERCDIDGLNIGVRYAQDLIDKLRVFASAGSHIRSGPLDVANDVGHTIELIRPSLPSKVSLSVICNSAHAVAYVARSDIHQVMCNYIFNAIDAVGESGDITVEFGIENVTETCASCAEPFSGQYLVLKISDNGPGVSPSVAECLFEPLVTTKSPGSGGGLGLSTVHGIVHHVGGHVGFTARNGGGCSFIAYFIAGT